ncbi:MAG: apolipoprotein N-acyltransferase [bacterium]
MRLNLRFAGWRRVGMAFGLGALMALGQAPLGLWWVTLPAVALLLNRLAGQNLSAAMWMGWFAGAGYFAVALNWIISPFLVNAAQDGWMAPFAVVLLAFGLALFWAAACGLAWGWRRPLLALVTTLTVAELLRGYVLTGFPWALIGHIWIDLPPDQVAALIGPSGLTLLTLAAAGLLARWRPVSVTMAVAVVAAMWAYGWFMLAQPLPMPPGVVVRLVQPNAPEDAKWNPEHAQMFFDRLMTATASPPTQGMGKVDLVIWPETALPYLVIENPDLPAMIGGAARGAAVAVGMQRVAGGLGWNAMQVYGPDGSLLASYDKHHLVPFGEYIPLGDSAFDLFGVSAFSAKTGNAYTAGPGPAVLDLGPKLGHVMPLICYEAVFPQDLRGPSRPDWLMQITNDAWFGTISGPFQHAAQARLRAVEQGLPLVRVANTGVTEVVDARGRVTAELPFGTEGFLDAALPGPLPATPYSKWGEIPVLVLLAGLLALILVKGRRPLA